MYFEKILVLLAFSVYSVVAPNVVSARKSDKAGIDDCAHQKLPGVYVQGKYTPNQSTAINFHVDIPLLLDPMEWIEDGFNKGNETTNKEKVAQINRGNFSCMIDPVLRLILPPMFYVVPIDDFLTMRKALKIKGKLGHLAADYLQVNDRTLVFVAAIAAPDDKKFKHVNNVLAQLTQGSTAEDIVVVFDPKAQGKIIDQKTKKPYPSEPKNENSKGKLPEIIEKAKQTIKDEAMAKAEAAIKFIKENK